MASTPPARRRRRRMRVQANLETRFLASKPGFFHLLETRFPRQKPGFVLEPTMPVEQVKVPRAGESISEVTVNRWLKADGDSVNADDPIVELGTDKATQEIPAPAAGVL